MQIDSRPFLRLTGRVSVEVKGRETEAVEVVKKPLHKKDPKIGEKDMVFSSKLIMEQEDAKSFGDNEEVSPIIVEESCELTARLLRWTGEMPSSPQRQ